MPQTTGPIAKLNELIDGIDTTILTTVRPDGTLHSCPMASHPADETGVLWFVSHNSSEKVEAVRTNQRVNLAYADAATRRYVSVSGFCELVRDHTNQAAMEARLQVVVCGQPGGSGPGSAQSRHSGSRVLGRDTGTHGAAIWLADQSLGCTQTTAIEAAIAAQRRDEFSPGRKPRVCVGKDASRGRGDTRRIKAE